MPIHDPRGVLLHLFDHQVDALVNTPQQERAERACDAATLNDLAAALADSIAIWGPIIGRLVRPPDPAFEPRRAGDLVIECVFDELLDPAECRVLAAAFDLAVSSR